MAKIRNSNDFFKYQIRRIWIIHALLSCNPLRQDDFLDIWHRIGEIQYSQLKEGLDSGMFTKVLKKSGEVGPLTLDDIRYWEYKKTNKGEISTLLKGRKDNGGLKKDGIVAESLYPREGRGGAPFVYSLVESRDALYTILVELNNPKFLPQFIRDMTNDLMASEYAKKVINQRLVDNVKSRLNINLNNKNQRYLLKILKISPSVLFEFLKTIHSSLKFKKYDFLELDEREEAFIRDIEFQLYNDIQDPLFISPYSVETIFEIKSLFKMDGSYFQHAHKIEGPYNKYYEPIKEPHFVIDIFTSEMKFNDGLHGEAPLIEADKIKKFSNKPIFKKSSELKHYNVKLPLYRSYSPLSYKKL